MTPLDRSGALPDRVTGDVPVRDAAVAAAAVADDATLAVSGFGSVGYPKAVPRRIAEAAATGDRDPALTVVSGGSVGPIPAARLPSARNSTVPSAGWYLAGYTLSVKNVTCSPSCRPPLVRQRTHSPGYVALPR